MRKVIVFALGSLSVASLASAAILIGCTEDTTVTSLDAGKDATVSETGTPDGASDAGSDVFTTDAPVPTIDSFRSQVADAICDLYAGCCSALDAGAAGKFSKSLCRNNFLQYGFEYSLTGLPTSPVNAANYNFDPTKGQECIGRIQQLKCGSNSAADYKAATQACFAAVSGKAAVGATCATTIDCAAGNYCDQTTKKCAALKAEGATCDPTGQNAANDECSYRSSGVACDTNNKKCVPSIATGQSCAGSSAYSASCQSGLCDPTTLLCASSAVLVYPPGTYPDGGPFGGTAYEGLCEGLSSPDGG